MDAGLSGSSFQRGDGPKPVPSGVSPLLGRGMGAAYPVLISRVADWNRNEPRSLVRFHPHQDASPAVVLGIGHRLAHVGWRGYRLAIDVENDVAGLELIARRAAGIDLSDHDALASVAGRRKRQTELRHIDAGSGALLGVGARLTLLRQLAEGEGQGIFLAAANDPKLDGGPGRNRTDAPCEITGVRNGFAVDRHDDVAGLDARLPGRAVGVRFRDEGTARIFHAEAVGNLNRNRCALDPD